MIRSMKSLLLPLALCAASTVLGQPLPDAERDDATFDAARLQVMHKTLDRFVSEGQLAGLITLVAHDGDIADIYATGYRDLEKKLPIERNTIFRVYSMTKIVTAVATLTLMEDGRINLDDPVANYLPELKDLKVLTGGTASAPILEPTSRPVTIQHLLTHTSGFGYDFLDDKAFGQIYKDAQLFQSTGLSDFVRKAAHVPLKNQPGEAFYYGINFDLLGALIERVSGKSFGAYLRERIFNPLQMSDTGFSVPAEKMNRLAKTYELGPDGKLREAQPMLNVWPEAGRSLESGGAGLFSTADDFARFAQMLLNGGSLDHKRILGRKTVELMTTNHLDPEPPTVHGLSDRKGFGYGVEVTTSLGHSSILTSEGQFGWYGAASTYCQIDPEENLVAIGLTQRFPFNANNFFAKFSNGYYQALGTDEDGQEVEPGGRRVGR